jgi:hypothetical protein
MRDVKESEESRMIPRLLDGARKPLWGLGRRQERKLWTGEAGMSA